MSQQTDDTPPPDDVLAAEYVLGLLEGDDWQAAKDRAAIDGAFAARVQAWETRLAPLNDLYDDAPAPDLMPQIEAQLFPAAPGRKRRSWLWGLLSGTAVAAAFGVALLVWDIAAPPSGPTLQAELVAEDRELVLQARFDMASAELRVSLRGQGAGADLDYELWVIDETEIPRSLGVLRDGELTIPAELAQGQVLALSLEPAGGSPTGLPTGDVLAVAELTES
ncbi:anti-sigma factor [Roseinatronobacter alkalisoli]|uniref:Anti-sigma factor n=1 Tax=Roseinatronobacter alkalisoli TaxID=3028235 RepID=A0ABT5T6F1_9RHOB|nr:anti-sigma factor [Roseinatronobacter sp. HJB301]MDD7970690.1 anti-sigma factor [Roseinatronobacter sp. HJB301]